MGADNGKTYQQLDINERIGTLINPTVTNTADIGYQFIGAHSIGEIVSDSDNG